MAARLNFEAVFNEAPNPYMLLDRDFCYAAVNEAYLRVTGRTREELIGTHLFDAFPGDPSEEDDANVRQLRASLEKVFAQGERDTLALIRYAIPRQTPDGQVFDEHFWSATHTPIFGDNGEVEYVLQHTVNVTELQELKQELRVAKEALAGELPVVQIEQGVFRRAQIVQQANVVLDAERKQLRQLFEQAPGFIAVLRGTQHIFTLANRAYYQLVGHRELIGLPLREALPEIEGQGFFELVDQVYASGEPFVGEGMVAYLQRKPGAELEERFIDFIFQPVFEPDGSVYGIFIQGHDVTEQKQAEFQLRELNETLERRVEDRTAELEVRNRELQQFAHAASHDLREPLRKISAFAGLLEMDHREDLSDEARQYIDRMKSAAIRMSTLITDLLSLSRVATDTEPFEPVDLNKTAQDVLFDLNILIEETGAEVQIEPLATIEADAIQMHQLLQNLISNAIKFSRQDEQPIVTVRSQIEENGQSQHCRLEVIDNGIGFDEKYLDRIFSPFQRLHGRSMYEGTGMGLAICRRIVERHKGTITAESQGREGSRFLVTLPVKHGV